MTSFALGREAAMPVEHSRRRSGNRLCAVSQTLLVLVGILMIRYWSWQTRIRRLLFTSIVLLCEAYIDLLRREPSKILEYGFHINGWSESAHIIATERRRPKVDTKHVMPTTHSIFSSPTTISVVLTILVAVSTAPIFFRRSR